MRVIALVNEKGGVGKSTISFHLAYFLAERKKKTVAIDMDPQAHLSLTFNLNEPRTHLIFKETKIDPIPVNEYLSVVSSVRTLVEVDRSTALKHTTKLRKSLETVQGEYDFAVIDTPPGLDVFTLNALFAAHGVLIPVHPGLYSFKGLMDVLDDIKWVKEDYNPTIEIAGVVVNFSERTLAALEMRGAIEEKYKDMVIAQIPKTVRIEEAIRRGIPVWQHAPDNPASDAFRELGEKILKW
ncbi:MAG TPA: ParA family protein [Thermodesulfobacteriota bacterium]|nr:ParA family protein [Thermodesulfobacteriota bacterium]